MHYLYWSQTWLNIVNSILTPCIQPDNMEYILLTSLLSETDLKKLAGFSVITGFSSFLALYNFNSLLLSELGMISANLSLVLLFLPPTFLILAFFSNFFHVATPLETLRMILPAWTNMVWTSSMAGRTSISGMLK